MIALQSFFERLGVIITSLDEWFTGNIVFHRYLRRRIGEMVCTTGSGMNQTAGNT